jgi:hypothetical protein
MEALILFTAVSVIGLLIQTLKELRKTPIKPFKDEQKDL